MSVLVLVLLAASPRLMDGYSVGIAVAKEVEVGTRVLLQKSAGSGALN